MKDLSEQEIAAFKQDFKSKKRNAILGRATRRNGLLAASFNDRVAENLNHVFSTELDVGAVTDQKRSGRCWEFATLNILRHYFGKKYKVKDFTFSQAYLFFWDKIERANAFYEAMIRLAGRDINDREVQTWLAFAGQDGGLWQMGINLVLKYGLVPSYAMPESFDANHTAALIDTLGRKERKDALYLRKIAKTGERKQLAAAKKKCLSEVYQIAAIAIGIPPEKFDLEYRDDKKKYHLVKDITPRQFVAQYLKDFPFDDYVVLLNTPNFDYGKIYHQGLYDNVTGGAPIQGLNLPIEDLAAAALAQLKAGAPVMFGNDVLKEMERKTGYLDPNLYKTDDLIGVNTQMNKADRLNTGEGFATHDMTLVGVDEDHGHIRKWKVENSWGNKVGKKGFFIMSHDWFKAYVYDVVVNKKYLPKEQQEMLKQKAVDLKPYAKIGL